MRKRENPKICTNFVVVYNRPKGAFINDVTLLGDGAEVNILCHNV